MRRCPAAYFCKRSFFRFARVSRGDKEIFMQFGKLLGVVPPKIGEIELYAACRRPFDDLHPITVRPFDRPPCVNVQALGNAPPLRPQIIVTVFNGSANGEADVVQLDMTPFNHAPYIDGEEFFDHSIQIKPMTEPVMSVASVPATSALGASAMTSWRRSGASAVNPPMTIPRLAKLAKPHMA